MGGGCCGDLRRRFGEDSDRRLPRAAMGILVAAIRQSGTGLTESALSALACRWRLQTSGRKEGGEGENYHTHRCRNHRLVEELSRFAEAARASGRLAFGRCGPSRDGQSASLVCHVSKLGATAGWQWSVVSSRPQTTCIRCPARAALKRGLAPSAPAMLVVVLFPSVLSELRAAFETCKGTLWSRGVKPSDQHHFPASHRASPAQPRTASPSRLRPPMV